MARTLVTGGAGFIGTHLCHALVGAGHDVVVLDDLSTGNKPGLPETVRFHQGDIRDPHAVAQAIVGCTAVVHLAAIASVMKYLDDWQGASSVNLGGTINVMQAAATAGLPVIYASSAAVYGAATDLPLREETTLVPISGYGADKLACELQARAMADVHGLASVGLRFFNVYGPGQLRGSAYSGVITAFLDRWLRNAPLQIFGDGTQSRDFIYVGDIVRAIVAALELATRARCEVVNVCSGAPTTINDLVAMLSRATGHRFDLRHAPARAGEILHSLGDDTKARDLLGFQPETTMHDGLASLVDWFRANPD